MRICYLSGTRFVKVRKFIHFHPFILCSPIRFLRVIMINRRYVYINIISLEFVLRKYAGVKYCFLIIAISVFSI